MDLHGLRSFLHALFWSILVWCSYFENSDIKSLQSTFTKLEYFAIGKQSLKSHSLLNQDKFFFYYEGFILCKSQEMLQE